MSTNRTTFFFGLSLIILGVILLVSYFLPNAWPAALVCIGLYFLIVTIRWREGWAVIPGLVSFTLGAILLYQTLTGFWRSWYFLWPLIFAAVGGGLLISERLDSQSEWSSMRLPQGPARIRYLRMSWAWLILSLLATVVLWLFRAQISWPSIIWGMGALFLLVALVSGIGPLAIPGAILGGLGLLLTWQNSTGAWNTWAFAWPLIPAFVGLGLLLAFRSRVMRVIGLSMLAWSLVVFALFGIFFAGHGAYIYLWPAILILAGIVIILQAFLVRAPSRRQENRQNQL